MTTYTTAQLDAIIAQLEGGLGKGYIETVGPDGRKIVYRSVAEIRTAIAYFTSLYDNATDAPPMTKPKTRTFFFYGNKGIGI